MQFPAIYSSTFFLFILVSTKLVASAPLPYHDLNSGGIDIPAGEQSAPKYPTPKLPAGAVPECEVPNVTTLPACLTNPAVEECTEWVQRAAAECVKFNCPSNEGDPTCLTMLQITLESKTQTELAKCYEAKVKEVCPIKATTLPGAERLPSLNGRSTGIPDLKQASTNEVEYPKTPGPEAPSADIPKAPTTHDAPYVETRDKKLPNVKAPKTEVLYALDVDGARKKVPAGVIPKML
ncbi:hypothetical protein BGX38DRAFT_1276019 [Terfezia claveryi]|nr:hypothetical protein BGX38DRAFT_1276019 [Terfezia claveryi]